MAEAKRKGVHHVIVGRRSARIKKEVEARLKGQPEFMVIVDRRKGERRRGTGSMRSDKRKGKDRRV